jgi:hypothetical protein
VTIERMNGFGDKREKTRLENCEKKRKKKRKELKEKKKNENKY